MKQKAKKVTKAKKMSWPLLKWPEKSRPAKTKTFLIHSFGRPVLIAARSGLRRGSTGSSRFWDSAGGTVGCSEVIVSINRGGLLAGGGSCRQMGCERVAPGSPAQGSSRTP